MVCAHGVGEVPLSIGLGAAVERAAVLGRLPRQMLLYGVEVDDTSFGLGLTPAVAAAAEHLTDEIAGELSARSPVTR
jgi:hydrogenase maturation protease